MLTRCQLEIELYGMLAKALGVIANPPVYEQLNQV